ncbi:hypothetical protein [Nocardia niigatensis]
MSSRTQTFAPNGEFDQAGRTIYNADGPVTGLFVTCYGHRRTTGNKADRGWVFNLLSTATLGLRVNRVQYTTHMIVLAEHGAAEPGRYQPGYICDWHVRKAEGRWDDIATPSARKHLEHLAELVYAKLHTPHALWQAKIAHAERDIETLQATRATFLKSSDSEIDAAVRQLNEYLNDPQ